MRLAYLILSYFFRHAEEDDINAPPPQIQAAIKNNDIGNLLDLDWDAPAETPVSPIMSDPQQQQGGSFSDLLSIGGGEAQANAPGAAKANTNGSIDDIMNLFNTPSNSGMQQQQSFASPQQPQQPSNNLMNDFTSDLFGSSMTQSPIQQQQQQQQQPSNTAKDPFADLF